MPVNMTCGPEAHVCSMGQSILNGEKTLSKSLFIAEKPSVAQQFAQVLQVSGRAGNGYLENDRFVVTWCVGHLVTMSYPEVYDEKYRRWSLATLPFIPEEWKYEIIPDVKKQFEIVSGLLNREDVGTIYVCTDSGREGEYIYRLVAQMAGVKDKIQKRVWIDSQTEEEIRRGIREAKDEAEYDNLSDAAYLRAKEDYLMGINFSRVLTLKYGQAITNYRRAERTVISVGRVMTCVLGMVVKREREIRNFVKTPFYRVIASFGLDDAEGRHFSFDGEWKAVTGSKYFQSPILYKENGFAKKEDAEALMRFLTQPEKEPGVIASVDKKKELRNPPMLYNLAELQNDCSKIFKLSPDQTLAVIQELYEKKLVTYPRTDARVLSTAVAKEIDRNIRGIMHYGPMATLAGDVLELGRWKSIARTKYVNDSAITDHYAVIPTGSGLGALNSLTEQKRKIYELICRRFLSIFCPPAVFRKYSIEITDRGEHFFANFKTLEDPGFFKVAGIPAAYRKKETASAQDASSAAAPDAGEGMNGDEASGEDTDAKNNADLSDPAFLALLEKLRKGSAVDLDGLNIKEGETSPPKRYTSGSMILAMENAGQLIEDETLREEIKGSGIGTSATRADILKKLFSIGYLSLNKKTQVITPAFLGECIYVVVGSAMRPLLEPSLTASWERGLTQVSEGTITGDEYMTKLSDFVSRRTAAAINGRASAGDFMALFDTFAKYYKENEIYDQGRKHWAKKGSSPRKKAVKRKDS